MKALFIATSSTVQQIHSVSIPYTERDRASPTRNTAMAPNEATILENYLLLPARLPAVVSLQEFTSYFPKSQQSSPQIRTLYRDLQQQRNAVVDTVAANIDTEVQRGKALRRAVIKARREAAQEDDIDDEIEIERNARISPFVLLAGRLVATLVPPFPWNNDKLTISACNSYLDLPQTRYDLKSTLYKASCPRWIAPLAIWNKRFENSKKRKRHCWNLCRRQLVT